MTERQNIEWKRSWQDEYRTGAEAIFTSLVLIPVELYPDDIILKCSSEHLSPMLDTKTEKD